ncbi:MAG: Eco57I restriction-modification methylase domain-containing protein [Planctomycetota bacterium]|jgi:hypothetical protein
MQNTTFTKNLELLDFRTDSPVYGLLFTRKIASYKKQLDKSVSFDEILTLNQAKDLGAKAVYFRRIEGKGSVPQLFVFDNSDNSISSQSLIDIHTKLWSSGIVPMYYIISNTELKVFDCRKSISKKLDEPDPIELLSLTSKVNQEYQRYSAKLFENGSFWDSDIARNRFQAEKSSYEELIKGLRRIRNKFSGDPNAEIYNKLVVLSIFVKYLEERKDKDGQTVLPEDYFDKYNHAISFCDVLRKGKCLQLFNALSKEVNGKIFQLTPDEKKQIRELEQSRLSELANFLDANIDHKNQLVFWRLYNFNYLPIELISRIYEEFIPDRKDIAYTPKHLVDFMIDESMPLKFPRGNNFKIADVSCGSGIFLVGAFKRIAQWWQKEQYEETGEIKRPTITKLKNILAKQIFGIDLEVEAVRLAKFSLTIALCDMLNPKKMWQELTEKKLIDLSSNIVKKDFFDYVKTEDRFDLVIGNPPFNLPQETKKERDEYWDKQSKKANFRCEIPQRYLALGFMEQATQLLKKRGLLAGSVQLTV